MSAICKICGKEIKWYPETYINIECSSCQFEEMFLTVVNYERYSRKKNSSPILALRSIKKVIKYEKGK